MGTRSITILREGAAYKSKDGPTEIAVVYRQYDGYPTGQGQTILDALGGSTCRNGYSTPKGAINGPGDMCVQLIAYMKQDQVTHRDHNTGETVVRPLNSAGGIYLYPPGTRAIGEGYTYTLTFPHADALEAGIHLKVEGHKTLYDGPLKGFDPAAAEAAEHDEDED